MKNKSIIKKETFVKRMNNAKMMTTIQFNDSSYPCDYHPVCGSPLLCSPWNGEIGKPLLTYLLGTEKQSEKAYKELLEVSKRLDAGREEYFKKSKQK